MTALFLARNPRVDFTGPVGLVIDTDQGAVQGTFNNLLGTDPIGFYLRLFAPADPVLDGTTIFTEAILNGGTDLSAAYPVFDAPPILDNALLIGFRDPRTTDLVPIYASLVGPPNPVPLPGAIFLWLTGLAGLALFRHSLASDRPVTATAAR